MMWVAVKQAEQDVKTWDDLRLQFFFSNISCSLPLLPAQIWVLELSILLLSYSCDTFTSQHCWEATVAVHYMQVHKKILLISILSLLCSPDPLTARHGLLRRIELPLAQSLTSQKQDIQRWSGEEAVCSSPLLAHFLKPLWSCFEESPGFVKRLTRKCIIAKPTWTDEEHSRLL